MKIEYKVRPVTRYVVTRYEEFCEEGGNGRTNESRQQGEFENQDTAYAVGYALARAEAERLELPPGDMRVIYPDPIPTKELVRVEHP
jgi:hypothetical protein